MSEQSWQARLDAELKEVTDRLNKLTEFLESRESNDLSEEDQWLLNQQELAMDLYRRVLEKRVSLLKE